jgi:colanic acid/amylovoran biosynthesis protein
MPKVGYGNNKKIFISDSYSLNTGDLAILYATIGKLRESFKNVEVFIEASHPKVLMSKSEYLKNHIIFPRIFDIESLDNSRGSKTKVLKTIIIGATDSFTFLIWSVLHRTGINALFLIRKSRRKQAEALTESDFVLSSGGGYLSSNYKYGFRLYLYLVTFILGKKLYIFAQSIGPFDTKTSKSLIPVFLNKAELITVREPDSLKYLKRFKIRTKTILTADMAYTLSYSGKEIVKEINSEFPELNNNTKKVAICVRNPKNNKKKYYDSIVHAIDYLSSKKYQVILVAQTPFDIKVCETLTSKSKEIANLTIIPFQINPFLLQAVYGKCDFIIANRMHAIILGVTQGVPFIAISYEPKFQGLIQQLKYDEDYLINESGLSIYELRSKVSKMLANYSSLKSVIKVNRHEMINRSKKNLELVQLSEGK